MSLFCDTDYYCTALVYVTDRCKVTSVLKHHDMRVHMNGGETPFIIDVDTIWG